ncbi:MAG: cyclic nucleotide-binding domain-containing protein [Polyangiaceae bacterium]
MSWPEIVWSAAALREVDDRGRAEIEAAGALASLERGETIYSQGELADHFYVVESGEIEVMATPRGEERSRVLRRVGAGEAFGEEAMLRAGASRQMEARCAKRARVARVPANVFVRAAERAGGSALFASKKRSLERAATLDLLKTMALTRDLADADLEQLLDASEMRFFSRGSMLFRPGDPADEMMFLADGMAQLQTEDDGRWRVRAYLARGDEVGDVKLDAGAVHRMSAAASGPTSVIAIRADAVREVAQTHPTLFARARTLLEESEGRQADLARNAMTTQHVMKDLYRLEIARSLLVIDQESCVRCGHCAWSCASAHDDGVARLVRRGDKVVVGAREASSALLVPNSCQHCENPACMIDCPTGAIGRDPRGDVFIREEICIGCGNCAKGCPWDNIQMAPRSTGNKATSAIVAVKCDVCTGREEGPACVAACPVQAIARVSPADAIGELRVLRGDAPKDDALGSRIVPAPRASWPWWSAAGAFAVAIALFRGGAFVTGVVSGVVCLALAVYPLFKRVSRLRAIGQPPVKNPDRANRSRVHVHYVLHVALGTIGIGAVVAHTHLRLGGSLSAALAIAFAVASLFGIAGAASYAWIPRVLTRLDRKGSLPEDLAARMRETRERTYVDLTGRSELVKTIYRRLLAPYADSSIASIWLVLSGHSLREEERTLRERVDVMLEGRGKDKLDGLDALVRDVVERRALVAERVLSIVLRGWFAVHVVASVLVVILLACHAFVELAYPR